MKERDQFNFGNSLHPLPLRQSHISSAKMLMFLCVRFDWICFFLANKLFEVGLTFLFALVKTSLRRYLCRHEIRLATFCKSDMWGKNVITTLDQSAGFRTLVFLFRSYL